MSIKNPIKSRLSKIVAKFRGFHAMLLFVMFSLSLLCMIHNFTMQPNLPLSGELEARVVVEDTVEVPIIMYHALVKEKSKQNAYFINPKLFEEDLKYLQSHNFTPVFIADLINYVHNDTPLPQNPIVLTFDDGYYNNYLYAFPLLREYDMKAVISVVGTFSDQYSEIHDRNEYYAHLSWADVGDLAASGFVEIQNHSYALHQYGKQRKGAAQATGESDDVYKEFLIADLMKNQEKIYMATGLTPPAFTYPFGAYSDTSVNILKDMGFKSTLICYEGINTIKKNDEDSLYQLKRFLRRPNESSEVFFERLEQ